MSWPKNLGDRLTGLLWVLVFAGCLWYVYVSWLAPTFYYMGFPEYSGSRAVLWISLALVLCTAAALPLEINAPSEFFLWMIFYFVYVPSMVIVPLQGLLPDDGLTTILALAFSFHLMYRISRVGLRVPVVVVDRRIFTVVFFAVYVALNLYVASVFGDNLKLVGASGIYAQRALASDVATGTFIAYAAGLLNGAFNPFLIAVGLVERRRLWLVLGILGQIFTYATAAMKLALVSALIAPLLYLFLVRRPVISARRLGLLVAASCLLPAAIMPTLDIDNGGLALVLVTLVLMRTYGTSGSLTGVYADFFQHHPYTYYSHINLIAGIVPYPYDQSLGQVIGFDLVGAELDANANFWATDGIAAAGLVGVVAIGIVLGCFLSLCDGLIDRRILKTALIAFVPFIMFVSNTSFFSSLLTFGGAALLLMLYLWRPRPTTAQPSIAGRGT